MQCIVIDPSSKPIFAVTVCIIVNKIPFIFLQQAKELPIFAETQFYA